MKKWRSCNVTYAYVSYQVAGTTSKWHLPIKDYQFSISQLRTKSNEKWVDGNAKREANEWGEISQADTAGVISRTRRVLTLTRSRCVSWKISIMEIRHRKYMRYEPCTKWTEVNLLPPARRKPVFSGARFACHVQRPVTTPAQPDHAWEKLDILKHVTMWSLSHTEQCMFVPWPQCMISWNIFKHAVV